MVGTMAVSLRKYLAVSQAFKLVGTLGTKAHVPLSFNQPMAMVGTLTARVLRRVNGEATQTLRLGLSGSGYIKAHASASQAFALNGTLTTRVLRRVYSPVNQVFSMNGTLDGLDLYSGAAPGERQVAVAGSVRYTAVPGTANSIGV